MLWSTELVAMQAAVSGMNRRWLSLAVASWLSVAVFASISLPLKYPYQTGEEVVDSAVIVGLLIPTIVASQLLQEGPIHLVGGASRRPLLLRLIKAMALLSISLIGGAVAHLIAPVPALLVIGDSVLLAGLAILGTGAIGLRYAWAVPTFVVVICSSPRIIPWQFNLLYRADSQQYIALVACVTGILGLCAYCCYGSYGLQPSRAMRRPDQDLHGY